MKYNLLEIEDQVSAICEIEANVKIEE